MANNKPDLLVDVDEVICFTFLTAINDFLGTNYKINDFTDYYIDEVAIPKERFAEWNEYLNSINLYDKAVLLPGAVEALKKLNLLYNVHLLSSCVNPFNIPGSGRLFSDKYNFLISNLPFLEPQKFIFTSDKRLIKGDIQIDDLLSKLSGDIETRILFPSYHNRDVKGDEIITQGIIKAGDAWETGWDKVESILIDSNGEVPLKLRKERGKTTWKN